MNNELEIGLYKKSAGNKFECYGSVFLPLEQVEILKNTGKLVVCKKPTLEQYLTSKETYSDRMYIEPRLIYQAVFSGVDKELIGVCSDAE
jgi:hypothetical protein